LFADVAQETFQHTRQRAAVRLRAGRHAEHEFSAQGACLTAARVQAALGSKVGMHDNQLFLGCDVSDQRQEESLA
jgi:hypothetical protein